MKLHFFISRAGEDSVVATWIEGVLRAAGHNTTIQEDFGNGNFLHHIGQGMDAANRFIAVLSPHYLNKPFTKAEFTSYLTIDADGSKGLVIPVRVAECELPHPFKAIRFIEFVGKDEVLRKRALLHAVGTPATADIRTSIQKLPTVDPHLFGRDAQLEWLEQAWSNPRTNFVQIIAPGGAGKTALMTKWYRRHLRDVTVYGWSFYSQGTGEKSQTSSDPFFAEVLPWFGITVPATASIYAKVDALVERLRHERVLLILDGIEPLQDPGGGLRDVALKALLQELAARNVGMVLATTRVRLEDVPDDSPHAVSVDLENLDPVDGATYLAHLGVRGPEEELRAASEAYGNHALALTLLGTYLETFCEGDIRRQTDIRELQVDETKAGQHAHKVMSSYARMYDGQPEVEILRALGYFDRPAEPAALKLVLPAIDERKYRAALRRLHEARLILTTDPLQPVDCHPLIREHFSTQATPEGHARLYEHYKNQAPHQPDTLEEMTPLFYAVYHGCQSGRHQAALDEVHFARIQRGNELYLWKKLGAFGTDLSLLANFFATRWTQPVAALSTADQSWVIGQIGSVLRAVGRLADAAEPMGVGAKAMAKRGDWKNAAAGYSNLSELHVSLGDLSKAVAAARQSVDFADRGGEWHQEIINRTTLADALHQAGHFDEAKDLFADAERLQAENQSDYPILYSLPGYLYCDLLLGEGEIADVLGRSDQTLRWGERGYSLLSLGLDHLSLGRAYPSRSAEAAQHLDKAVEFLRRAGTLHRLPLGLLARGKPRDLDEVFRIASRSGMRLHLTDYHLASARLALGEGDSEKARGHFEKAEVLIQATGYHRRDSELEELRIKLQALDASGGAGQRPDRP